MKRTELLQGIRIMKFEEVYERSKLRLISQYEAASMSGVSARTFRRRRDRYQAFPPAEAKRIAARFEWHYTPKHGSRRFTSQDARIRLKNLYPVF